MMNNLIATLQKMYRDPDYKEVDDAKIDGYVEKGLITAEEAAYVKGEIEDE